MRSIHRTGPASHRGGPGRVGQSQGASFGSGDTGCGHLGGLAAALSTGEELAALVP